MENLLKAYLQKKNKSAPDEIEVINYYTEGVDCIIQYNDINKSFYIIEEKVNIWEILAFISS